MGRRLEDRSEPTGSVGPVDGVVMILFVRSGMWKEPSVSALGQQRVRDEQSPSATSASSSYPSTAKLFESL